MMWVAIFLAVYLIGYLICLFNIKLYPGERRRDFLVLCLAWPILITEKV